MRHLSRLALVLGALIASAPVSGQIAVTPESLRVVLPQGQEQTATVQLQNVSAVEQPYCLDFDRPMQRLADPVYGGCGPFGQLLDSVTDEDVGHTAWNPYGLTMTPTGRLFVSDRTVPRRTYELDASLNLIRFFQTPTVTELDPFPETVGVTYNEDTGTLWWTNAEITSNTVHRVLLLEGRLDGGATGRRIELPIAPTGPPPTDSGYPKGASYDPSTRRYYFVDGLNDRLWAVDTLGTVIPGYPRELSGYEGWNLANGVDAHGGVIGGPDGVRLDVLVGPPGSGGWDRLIVTDPLGTNHNAVTMVPSFGLSPEFPEGVPVRSQLDPNGITYMGFRGIHPQTKLVVTGIAAVRPAPLSPTWLSLPAWSGTIPAGGTSEVTLTFRAGQRAPGEYRSTLVVEDTAGVALASVPLSLVVEAAPPSNEPGPRGAGVSLAVSPNPITTRATATVTLRALASEVTVTVHDVLGRQTALVHHGPLPAGDTTLALGARSLPAGVYVVRAIFDGVTVAQRITILR